MNENTEDPKSVKAKTKSRARKKVSKEDADHKDQAEEVESTLGSGGDLSIANPEKKSTKLTKSRSTKKTKVKLDPEASEISGQEEKISKVDDKSIKSEKDEKKKTRRRGWWSKDS